MRCALRPTRGWSSPADAPQPAVRRRDVRSKRPEAVNRPELSAEDILAALNRHHVDYLVIEAFAAIAQGASLEPTHDVDVTPGGTPTTSAGSPRR